MKTDIKVTRIVSGSGRAVACWGAVTVALAVASTASAIPPLQLYIEGATYDSVTGTWAYQQSSAGEPIRLWTVANVEGPGSKGAISDVHLAISYAAGATPDITLTGSTTGNYGGWQDLTTPANSESFRTVMDGSAPMLSDGSRSLFCTWMRRPMTFSGSGAEYG